MLTYLKAQHQALGSIAVRAGSVVAGFLVTYYIGHSFGPVANGQYALIAQTAMFLSIVAIGGMDLAVIRYFSATQAFHVPLGRGSLARALGYSVVAGALIVVILGATHKLVRDWLFHGEAPANAIAILAVILMVRTTTRVTAAVLRSQNHHLMGQMVDVLMIPGLVTALLVVRAIASLQQVLYATAAVGLLAACFGLYRSARFTSAAPDALDVPFRSLIRTSLPLWLNAIALNIADWYCLATAATLGVYEAGLFRVSFQIGTALSFCAMGIYNVYTAKISAAVAVGDLQQVARLSRSATLLSVLILLPVVLVLFVGGNTLLGFIGPKFLVAGPMLKIFLVGQLIYVTSGPAGLVLAMTGHERVNLAISASVTGGLLIAAPVAAHFGGLYGLTVASACVPVAGNIANFIAVLRLEKINAITGFYFGELRHPIGGAEPGTA